MNGWTACPGCRLELPTEDRERDHRVNASPECLHVYGEVTGFATQHPPLMRLHQLTVDAYGAQHGAGGTPPIRLAFSLVGLYLALEQKLTGAAGARRASTDGQTRSELANVHPARGPRAPHRHDRGRARTDA